jgi:hypothetical protein
MKVSTLRAALALFMALTLAACGGKATYPVTGIVSNLTNPGLVLENGSDTLSVPVGATSFTMPQQVSYGTQFDVEVKTQPDHMNCVLSGNQGSAGFTTTIVADVVCTQNSYTLGGTINGLTADGLVLANGSATAELNVSSGATSFIFGSTINYGSTYGVTVFAQPTGLTCSVVNGTGIMGEGVVSNVIINCVPNPS